MLNKILAAKRVEIASLDEVELRAAALDGPPPRPFLAEADSGRVRLIAELKRASPSRGLLAPHLDLHEVARIYAENGAAAISVLTDEQFFMGRLETLSELRAAEDGLPLPVPRHRIDSRVAEIALRLQELDVALIELNPVIVNADGAVAVDALCDEELRT